MAPQLTDVPGIGPSTARVLEKQGIRSVAALAKAGPEKVVTVPGFGQIRAAEVIAAAAALLAAADAPTAGEQKTSPVRGKKTAPAKRKKSDKEKKKKEKSKKGKNKNNDKKKKKKKKKKKNKK